MGSGGEAMSGVRLSAVKTSGLTSPEAAVKETQKSGGRSKFSRRSHPSTPDLASQTPSTGHDMCVSLRSALHLLAASSFLLVGH